jgi:transposase
MLADQADHLIGVDTHRDTHTAAVVETATGQAQDPLTTQADARGYERLYAFGVANAPGRRVWAIESTGSYGAGLATYLRRRSERVVEVDRPKRARRRSGKSDPIDALRAAREALERPRPSEPRQRGEREAMRVLGRTREGAVRARAQALCHLRSLVVTAPDDLRSRLRRLAQRQLVRRCAGLRTRPGDCVERRATLLALRSCARRIVQLEAEADELEAELGSIVRRVCPALLAEPGVGVLSAAELLNAWSHRGRVRSEAAFAKLGGVAPLPASSGQTIRHRLNREGDRRLNRALHTIVVTRVRDDPETRDYVARRIAEGKTKREIRRCLKRYLARRFFRLLEAQATMA